MEESAWSPPGLGFPTCQCGSGLVFLSEGHGPALGGPVCLVHTSSPVLGGGPGALQELRGECLKNEGNFPEALSGSGALSSCFHSSALCAVIVPSGGQVVCWVTSVLCLMTERRVRKVRDAWRVFGLWSEI